MLLILIYIFIYRFKIMAAISQSDLSNWISIFRFKMIGCNFIKNY